MSSALKKKTADRTSAVFIFSIFQTTPLSHKRILAPERKREYGDRNMNMEYEDFPDCPRISHRCVLPIPNRSTITRTYASSPQGAPVAIVLRICVS